MISEKNYRELEELREALCEARKLSVKIHDLGRSCGEFFMGNCDFRERFVLQMEEFCEDAIYEIDDTTGDFLSDFDDIDFFANLYASDEFSDEISQFANFVSEMTLGN